MDYKNNKWQIFRFILLSVVICALFLTIMQSISKIIKKTRPKIVVTPTAGPPVRKTPFEVKGSIPYWDQEEALTSFQNHVDSFNYINLFWYFLTSDGKIRKYSYAVEDASIIEFAHANNVKVFAVLTNLPEYEGAQWDSKRVENIIKSRALRKKHIEDIIKKLNELGFDGISIDYEEVDKSQREQFTQFMQELTDEVHKHHKNVTVALHPKTKNFDPKESLGAFQDWSKLARVTDRLHIMAYGEHWDGSHAGPIASTGWIKKIIKYTQNQNIPPEKIVLGIPLYGYVWKVDEDEQARGVTYEEVQTIIDNVEADVKWDDNAKSPYFSYEEDDETFEVWYENVQSIEEKAKLTYTAGFAGVTFWRLGGEDIRVWNMIKNVPNL